MSDDRQEPPDGTGADDRTRWIFPPPGGPAAEDRTQQIPPTGGAAGWQEPADRTAPLPPTGRDAPWAGRAGVPTRPLGHPEPAGGEWYGEEPNRRWWTPILIGIIALVLLGLLGFGLWLVSVSNESPDPEPTPTPAPTTAPATTAAPTSAAPTTTPPGTTPPATAPAEVSMPPLVGLSRETAEGLLDRLGIDHRVELRESDDAPPGTVIETDPEAGEPVPTGEEVTVVVAAAAPASTEPGPDPTLTR